jgi:hypothetical protein
MCRWIQISSATARFDLVTEGLAWCLEAEAFPWSVIVDSNDPVEAVTGSVARLGFARKMTT